ncbi:NTP transferase domain-containing protein [Luteimonas colneyensis]|nr:NTP transferase domain-containing protein [Luteimonas colneyensis]
MLEIGGRTLLSRMIDSLTPHVRRIHVVVGYREDLVINLCSNLHRNVVIVRNPDFRSTNTVQSMASGARGLSGKTIFLDGDLIIDPSSLGDFARMAAEHDTVAAIALSRSENAVNVDLSAPPGAEETTFISGFTREADRLYEWANVVSGDSRLLDHGSGYVYEELEKLTPLCASLLELREIDTPRDLEMAEKFAKHLDAGNQL